MVETAEKGPEVPEVLPGGWQEWGDERQVPGTLLLCTEYYVIRHDTDSIIIQNYTDWKAKVDHN